MPKATVCGQEVELPNPTNNQEVFDYVAERIFRQGEPSHTGGSCRYRIHTSRQLACAAGWLIPDADYSPAWECSAVHTSLVLSAVFKNNVSEYFQSKLYSLNLIHDLQQAHDSHVFARDTDMSVFKQDFLEELQQVAVAYSLNTLKLDQLKNEADATSTASA